ncbi:hypothetical protein FH972_016335 [Carpinus fangiana]|uniref:Leucine-rich repeat-containing N-terminal plant-type domain-containing protein n=1 Tax=Carpinus fangiana TaxID=176857 RepID=A0A5N6RG35_9ROSI|nr:hypothetical protein FH972_016335 [Carpinus fangiana]
MLNLIMLNLANNNLFGRLFDFIGGICDHGGRPRTLHLQNNNFIGGLPKSLMNCSSLKVLDLGENKLSGRIPTWIGTSLPDLVVLRLPSNLFIGRMPLQLCHLTSLQILDLSPNNITGTIPLCLSNFTAMAQKQNSDVSISYPYTSVQNIDEFSSSTSNYFDHTLVIIKGKYLEYKKTLGLVKIINLSSNRLKGEIPGEISSLSRLIGLNISKNLLSGIIPWSIGDLDRLESLDLSRNHLSGIIPPSLASLSFLSYLNLSNNNLSSRIPTGTQLQSFSGSTYSGNLYLCGLPLPKRCLGDEAIPIPSPKVGGKQEDGNIQAHASIEPLWFYTGIAFGFVSGFWGVCGLFLLKPSWRHAYYRLLDRIGDRLYVAIANNKAKLLRNFKTRCQRGL